MITVYGIKNCDTVKRARKWFEQHGIDYHFHDFRIDGLESAQITKWVEQIGWQDLLNRRSTTWRNLTNKPEGNIDNKTATQLMAANPTLIKRPVVCRGTKIYVGFSPEEFTARFKN